MGGLGSPFSWENTLQFVQVGDVVITMLPDDRVVQEAVTGKDGAMEGMPEGRGG